MKESVEDSIEGSIEWLAKKTVGWERFLTWDYWEGLLLLLLDKALILLLIFFLTWLALRIRKTIIMRGFKLARLEAKQAATLQSLLFSFTRYVIFIISGLLVLSNLGMDIAPIIASAGVIGLAVGFGAQTLVKDLITGFFIIFEDQFSVGDYVSINGSSINGTVISVGLRATKIRTWAQHVVVIQNSEIKVSQNYNRQMMRVIVQTNVPYETDPADIEYAVQAVSEKMIREMPEIFLTDAKSEIIEAPQLYGIADVENNSLGAKYIVTCLVKDTHYWAASKQLRGLLLEELKRIGVRASFPSKVEERERGAVLPE